MTKAEIVVARSILVGYRSVLKQIKTVPIAKPYRKAVDIAIEALSTIQPQENRTAQYPTLFDCAICDANCPCCKEMLEVLQNEFCETHE